MKKILFVQLIILLITISITSCSSTQAAVTSSSTTLDYTISSDYLTDTERRHRQQQSEQNAAAITRGLESLQQGLKESNEVIRNHYNLTNR